MYATSVRAKIRIHTHIYIYIYIYTRKGGTFKLKPLSGADVKGTCKETKLLAAGLDQWSTQDFSILNDPAYDWLACMYNEIEKGASWPEPTLHAKGSYLSKKPRGPRGAARVQSVVCYAGMRPQVGSDKAATKQSLDR